MNIDIYWDEDQPVLIAMATAAKNEQDISSAMVQAYDNLDLSHPKRDESIRRLVEQDLIEVEGRPNGAGVYVSFRVRRVTSEGLKRVGMYMTEKGFEERIASALEGIEESLEIETSGLDINRLLKEIIPVLAKAIVAAATV